MEGLDASFDGICFVSYHGSIGAERAVLSHTYSPSAIWEVRINDEIVGESGLNALVAAYYNVPIILVSGDAVTAQEAQFVASDAEKVIVKESRGRFAAAHTHPTIACEMLREGATRAIRNIATIRPPQFTMPITVEVTFLVADMAEASLWIRGVERVSARTVKMMSENALELYSTFVAIITLTRSLVDR